MQYINAKSGKIGSKLKEPTCKKSALTILSAKFIKKIGNKL
jgi:hypothetical protein